MSASHGGFGSERVPLGGGAAIFERLAAAWRTESVELTLLGAGTHEPEDLTYERLLELPKAPSELGMLEYARFCRDFGRLTTDRAIALQPDLLLCHDISEGPDMERLHRAGVKTATIFHVDVVDIFNRLYMLGLLDPAALTQGFRRFRKLPWPSVLKLVFENQQKVMDYSDLAVVPSEGAANLLRRCYPARRAKIKTIGWGAPEERFESSEIELCAKQLREEYSIPSQHRVLLTLSRLSPEKAQHRLLEAVRFAESVASMPPDITVVIAGAPAFMDGKRHADRLAKIAKSLKTRVVFPGHVGGVTKAAWYRMAHLFVVNSLHESYGLTTLEAMQQACPVVAVASFGTKATVDEQVGRLVPPGPQLEERLWHTLEYLLSENYRAKLTEMARAAKKKSAHETFSNASQRLLQELKSTTTTTGPGQ